MYGHDLDDWEPDRRRPRSLFGDDFDSIFRRPRFGFEDELFSDFEREFGEMHIRMDKILEEAMMGNLEKPGNGGPFVYGFSMRTGPDGIPHIQEFGNMPEEMRPRPNLTQERRLPLSSSGEACNSTACGVGPVPSERETHETIPKRKPLTDILECDDHISVIVELPGIEKKDINLEIIDNELDVDVDTPIRKYHNRIPLPAQVNPKSISASFNNGVLDVNMKRQKLKKRSGKQIKIK